MTSKLIVLTTDGSSREDGNVYYANFLWVSSDTLNFSEPVFQYETITVKNMPELAATNDPYEIDHDKLIAHIQSLGYTVQAPDYQILTTET